LEIKGNLIFERKLTVINMLPGHVSSQHHQGNYSFTALMLLPPLKNKQTNKKPKKPLRNW